ncbi:hypothetical protein [Streptomyces sp. NPDC029674]|uniref:hypothetical protein n=1 Tax=Streptomyces sp. NPDC029674 TaxID=3365297 RepID=UPI003851358F
MAWRFPGGLSIREMSRCGPAGIDNILKQVAADDVFTDTDLADLHQKIVRDVTQTLMFGAVPSPAGRLPTVHEQTAAACLDKLSTQALHHPDAAGHFSQLATRCPDNPTAPCSSPACSAWLGAATAPNGSLRTRRCHSAVPCSGMPHCNA